MGLPTVWRGRRFVTQLLVVSALVIAPAAGGAWWQARQVAPDTLVAAQGPRDLPATTTAAYLRVTTTVSPEVSFDCNANVIPQAGSPTSPTDGLVPPPLTDSGSAMPSGDHCSSQAALSDPLPLPPVSVTAYAYSSTP